MQPSKRNGPVTDISEYSWIAPLGSFWPAVIPGPAVHNWVTTAAMGSSLGKRAIGYAAKVLTRAAIQLLSRLELLEQAWREHKNRLDGRSYACLISDHIAPPVDMYREVMERYRTKG